MAYQQKINPLKGKGKFLIILILVIILILIGSYFVIINIGKSVEYTQNPTSKNIPLQSVVKIIVNKDTDRAASGSGLLFTDNGYILTNAHVVLSALGKPANSIIVCYTANNNQEINCDYDARLIDADREYDLAVIKVDKKIQEIKPYYLKIQEQDEGWDKAIVPIGSGITAVGYPGVGSNSITITKGIISGYKNQEAFYNDGSLQKIPRYIKTDTEINHGNSGGAVFDKDNRYVGISEASIQDEGGKISYIIFWNQINFYLDQLVFEGLLNLPNKQFIKRIAPASEHDLWAGINAWNADDLTNSKMYLEKYVSVNRNDSRAWNFLCDVYNKNKEYEKFGPCIQSLRESNPVANSIAWYYESVYNSDFEKDDNKAYSSINKAVNLNSEFPDLLNRKAELEIKLGKYDDAKKTINRILEIDDFDSEGLMNAGILAEKNNDIDSAINYYITSFSSNPNSKSSSKLAELFNNIYKTSNDYKDLIAALYYNIATLILDQKDISNLRKRSNGINNWIFINGDNNPNTKSTIIIHNKNL